MPERDTVEGVRKMLDLQSILSVIISKLYRINLIFRTPKSLIPSFHL